MKNILIALSTILFGFSVWGCTGGGGSGDSPKVAKKLDELIKQNEEMSRKLDQVLSRVSRGGGAERGKRQRPPEDTKTVHAVPVGDGPLMGKRHAKVTMVVAFEFA